jgi:serine/threonine protein kinase
VSSPNITRIGKYEIVDVLGRGGMGLVYRAFDKYLGREVAIKTVTENFSGDAEMLERFNREACRTGILKHPNIVTVYDLGEQDGFPYIVMEYVAGEPLDKLIRSNRPFPLAFKLKIIEQVCDALAYAHQNEIIHRDVKPANVIVQPDGVAKLLDFGIARQEKYGKEIGLTRTGNLIGTISYMAPERLQGLPFDGRSDIFATGIMLYQLVTGQLPFTGEDYAVATKLLHEKHPPLSNYLHEYPGALDAILDQSLAKNPEARYATAGEMAADVHIVAEAVKKTQIVEIFQQAERLVEVQEYTKAREILLQLVKLDSQHAGARQLMVIVQQNLSRRQRAEQVLQLRSRAEEAIQDRRYDQAIAHLEQAVKLDPSNPELTGRLEAIRQKKRSNDRIESFLQQADNARGLGNLEAAQALIQKALEIDQQDSRVRAAYSALAQQVENAALRRNHLQSVQQKIDATLQALVQFTQAGQYETAMSFLEMQPSVILESERIQAALKETREFCNRDQAALQVIAKAYAALDANDIASGWHSLQTALHAYAGSPLLRQALQRFESRQTPIANRALSAAIEQSQSALTAGNANLAAQILGAASPVLEYASPELRADWERLTKTTARARMLAHVGIGKPRSGSSPT